MHFRRYFFLLFLFFVLLGCGKGRSEWLKPSSELHILTTTQMICALVQEVGQQYIQPLSLIANQLDPHSYELVKGDAERLERADLIFYNGLGLEHGASLQRFLKDSPKAINLGQAIVNQDSNALLFSDGQQDPHIWMDLSLWAKAVPVIVAACQEKDPAHGQFFQENGEKLVQKLQTAHEQLVEQMAAVPENRRYLITSHDAFQYFTRAYLATPLERENGGWQKRCMAPEGLAPEGQISVREIQKVLQQMQEHQVHVLFFESNISRAALNKILNSAQQMGLSVVLADQPLYGDAMGPTNEPSGHYPGMVLYDGQVMREYWEKDE